MGAGKLVVLVVSALPDLAANFTGGMSGGVNVDICNTAGDGANDIREITGGNSLPGRSDHIGC